MNIRTTRIALRMTLIAALVAAATPLSTGCVGEEVSDDDDDDGGSVSDDDGSGIGAPSNSLDGQSCTEEGTAVCADATSMDLCSEGAYQNITCDEYCNYFGFAGAGCAGSGCECGDPINAQCAQGVGVLCGCSAAADAPPCSDEEMVSFYVACHQNDPELGAFVSCLGTYSPTDIDGCYYAFDSCSLD
jgi:hypothetical protein